MPLDPQILKIAIVNAIKNPDTPPETEQIMLEAWDKICTEIVNHIKLNAVVNVTVNATGPVAGGVATVTGTGTGTIQ